ncbi:MAG: CxxxxCH/CxxCH domain-containing protein [Candidatus Sulfobium sp.]|jgi:predicted CxxxxCH...CXXCH cytochrome family protein
MKLICVAFRGYEALAVKRAVVLFLSIFLVFAAASLAAAADCECIICHGPNGPHSGGFPGCSACHGNPPVMDQPGEDGLVRYPSVTGGTTAGAHEKHATPAGYNFDCQTCHYEGMPVTLIADNGELQMGFNYKGEGGGVYDGRILASPYIYVATNGTAVSTNGTMTCSNIYCHSDGTSVTTGAPPSGTSPAWGASGPVACNSCHSYPPQYPQDQPKSNSHVKHFEQLQQFSWFSCATCHYATTTDGLTIANRTNHVNMQYDVSPAPDVYFDYVYDEGGGKCLNISCHGGSPHPGWSNVWGAVELDASINAFYGPGCYQVTLIGSVTGGTPPYTIFWELGDDTTATGSPVIHSYAGSGPYFPRLVVTDVNNHVGTSTIQVTPLAANAFPIADKSLSVSGKTVTLTDLSYDPDYNLCGHSGSGIISISWGDGTPVMTRSINLTDSPSNIGFSHTYYCSSTCRFTVQHYVTDNSGAGPISSGNIQVTVPAQLTIGGQVLHAGGTAFSGVTMTLRRSTTGTTYRLATTDTNGNYSFTGIPGTECYTVTPTKPGTVVTFSPSVQTVCSSSSSVDFTGTP